MSCCPRSGAGAATLPGRIREVHRMSSVIYSIIDGKGSRAVTHILNIEFSDKQTKPAATSLHPVQEVIVPLPCTVMNPNGPETASSKLHCTHMDLHGKTSR